MRQCSASPACRECRQLRSGCSSSSVEGSVTAVAERGIPRVLAPAQVGRLRIFRREDFWRESGSLVRAVTERLIGRVSAGTSGVPLPHLEFDRIGLLLSQFRLRHEVSSCEGSVAGQPLYRGARDGRQRSPLDSRSRTMSRSWSPPRSARGTPDKTLPGTCGQHFANRTAWSIPNSPSRSRLAISAHRWKCSQFAKGFSRLSRTHHPGARTSSLHVSFPSWPTQAIGLMNETGQTIKPITVPAVPTGSPRLLERGHIPEPAWRRIG